MPCECGESHRVCRRRDRGVSPLLSVAALGLTLAESGSNSHFGSRRRLTFTRNVSLLSYTPLYHLRWLTRLCESVLRARATLLRSGSQAMALEVELAYGTGLESL